MMQQMFEEEPLGDFLVCNAYECDINIEDCASNPCQNKGECLDEVSNTTHQVQNPT